MKLAGIAAAALTVVAALSGVSSASAEPVESQPPASGGVIVNGPGEDVVQFPDGTYVHFAAGSVDVSRTARATQTILPSGTIIESQPQQSTDNSRAVFAPVTIWYSRADVEEMWRAKNNINNICRMIPLSYLGSIGCSAPGNLSDALDQAHYQTKRIKALYYQCSSGTYCSYYTYQVVA